MTEQNSIAEPVVPSAPKGRKVGIFFFVLMVIVIITGFSYGYWQLSKVNVALAHTVTDLKTQISNHQNEMTQLQQNVTEMSATLEKFQTTLTSQEQVLAEWRMAQKGNLNRWRVAQVQHLLKLADEQLQYAHDAAMAIILLERADALLQTLPESLSASRKLITNALTTLKAATTLNVTTLYLQLTSLNNHIDRLPLPLAPLQTQPATSATPSTNDLPWWRQGLDHTWQVLRKMVIVRNTQSTALPFILPEEKIFLYQNLHAHIASAMWAVLYHNQAIYIASLDRLTTWVKQYFVQDAQETKVFLETLNQLHQANLTLPAVDLAAPLQQLENYLTQVEPATPAPTAAQ